MMTLINDLLINVPWEQGTNNEGEGESNQSPVKIKNKSYYNLRSMAIINARIFNWTKSKIIF
jgi:hypothetical protein